MLRSALKRVVLANPACGQCINMHDLQTFMLCCLASKNRRRRISGAVINYDDLEVRIVLGEQCVERRAEISFFITRCDHQRHARRMHRQHDRDVTYKADRTVTTHKISRRSSHEHKRQQCKPEQHIYNLRCTGSWASRAQSPVQPCLILFFIGPAYLFVPSVASRRLALSAASLVGYLIISSCSVFFANFFCPSKICELPMLSIASDTDGLSSG